MASSFPPVLNGTLPFLRAIPVTGNVDFWARMAGDGRAPLDPGEHPKGSTCEHLKDPPASTRRDPLNRDALALELIEPRPLLVYGPKLEVTFVARRRLNVFHYREVIERLVHPGFSGRADELPPDEAGQARSR